MILIFKKLILTTSFMLLLVTATGIGFLLLTNDAHAAAGDIQVNFKDEFGNSFTPSGATIGYYCAGGAEQSTSSIATSSYAFTPVAGANCDTDDEAITINITNVGSDGYLKNTISSIWNSSTDPNVYDSANQFTVLVNLANEFEAAIIGGGNETAVFNPDLIWTEATPSAQWEARNLHTSVVYDNKMWVMGGREEYTVKNDVWYSTDGVTWTEATSSAQWTARYRHTSVVYDNKMWVMGGYTGGTRKNDVWYSTDGVTWTEATPSAQWSARSGHTSVVYDNKMWVIGGDAGTRKNDVWYSTDGVTWTEATPSAQWEARNLHTSVVYDDKMWVMGGYSPTYTNDVWYSTDGVTWTEATANAAWAARGYHTSVVYDDKMWVIGGSGPKNDLWYSTDGITWTQTISNADWTARKRNTTVIYNGKMWVMGGYSSTYINDVWYLVFAAGTEKSDNTKIGIPVPVSAPSQIVRTAGLGEEGYLRTDTSPISIPANETSTQTSINSANQFTLLVTVKNEFNNAFTDDDMTGEFDPNATVGTITGQRKSTNDKLGYPVPVGTASDTYTVTGIGDSGYLKYESDNISIPATETSSQRTVNSANQFTLYVAVKDEFGHIFNDYNMAVTGEFDPDATVGTVAAETSWTLMVDILAARLGYPVPVGRAADTYIVTGVGDYGYLKYESDNISIPATETDSQTAVDSANKFTVLVNLTNEFGAAIIGGGNETAIFDPTAIGDPSFGTTVTFDSDTVEHVSVARIDSTHVVIAYRDTGNSDYGTAVIGTISDSSISFGTPVVFNNAATYYISVTSIDSTHVVIAYSDNSNSDYGTAVVGTVSGDSISFGSPVVFEEGFAYPFEHSMVTIDSTHVVIGYALWDLVDGNGHGTAIIGTISGDSISFGTPTDFYSDETGNGIWYGSVAVLDSTHVVIGYGDGDNSYYGTAVVGTISGDSISFGTAVVFNETGSWFISVAALDSTHVVIGYKASIACGWGVSYPGTAIVGVIFGTSTISFGSSVVFMSSGCSNYYPEDYISVTSLDSTHVVIAYDDSSNSNYGTAITGTIFDSSISFGTPVVFESAESIYISVAHLDNNSIVIGYDRYTGKGVPIPKSGKAIVADLSAGISGNEKSDNTKLGIPVPVGTATSTVRTAGLGEEGYLRTDTSSFSVPAVETGTQTSVDSANQFTLLVTIKDEFGNALTDSDMTGEFDPNATVGTITGQRKSTNDKLGYPIPVGRAADSYTVTDVESTGYIRYESGSTTVPAIETSGQTQTIRKIASQDTEVYLNGSDTILFIEIASLDLVTVYDTYLKLDLVNGSEVTVRSTDCFIFGLSPSIADNVCILNYSEIIFSSSITQSVELTLGNICYYGGGGGVSPPVTPTEVNFSGKAYPNSVVTLLKDSQFIDQTTASSDSDFEIIALGLVGGTYLFSFYTEDIYETSSGLITMPVDVINNARTTVSGIFLPPTIEMDKSTVKQGDELIIFGQAVGNGEVMIEIGSGTTSSSTIMTTNSNADGLYEYSFDTTPLPFGNYTVKAKVILGEVESSYGEIMAFSVEDGISAFLVGDLNNDWKINIIDFTIVAFWYKRPLSEEFTKIEEERLNGDGKIDFLDFSIMTHYWTG